MLEWNFIEIHCDLAERSGVSRTKKPLKLKVNEKMFVLTVCHFQLCISPHCFSFEPTVRSKSLNKYNTCTLYRIL